MKGPSFLKKYMFFLLVSLPYTIVKVMIQENSITMWVFLINPPSSGKNK